MKILILICLSMAWTALFAKPINIPEQTIYRALEMIHSRYQLAPAVEEDISDMITEANQARLSNHECIYETNYRIIKCTLEITRLISSPSKDKKSFQYYLEFYAHNSTRIEVLKKPVAFPKNLHIID